MCTKLMAASTMIFGLVGALFPRRVLDLAERFVLVGYENPEDLEPSEWYVSATRAQSALSALAGGVVLALEYGSTCGSESDEDAADVEDAE
ncbi:hypothetical protein [Halobellus sp. Atlit-38R]|uniref:hypothetical protein n=1 Tax=Halobellus sp. Atlit-38R TaxID=2282131 RepID=UPI0011C44D78|nr:hypothetical protein [Halobellus sp. Atlit-38R]